MKIKFTQHAITRARQRKLWRYVNKEKFWFDAVFLNGNQAKLGECVYSYKRQKNGTILILTMYGVALR